MSLISKRSRAETESDAAFLDRLVSRYGDLLFDLCESTLTSSINAQYACRNILKKLADTPSHQRFEKFERAWVLRSAFLQLKEFDERFGKRVSIEEQVHADSGSTLKDRLDEFSSFFQRLSFEDRFLLLLIDRHQLPWDDASSAIASSVDSLQLKRLQAYRALRDWVWGGLPEGDLTQAPENELSNQLRKQPLISLPTPLRTAPSEGALPKIQNLARKSLWERLPWFVRTGAEGLGTAFAILFVIALIPHVRSLYEMDLEDKLNQLVNFDTSNEPLAQNPESKVPLARGRTETSSSLNQISDDYSGEADETIHPAGVVPVQGNITEDKPIFVGQAEIWRFNIRTSSPRETREKVMRTFIELRIDPETPGYNGVEAPGGIQFDMLLSKSLVPKVKQSLQRIGNSAKNLPGTSSSRSTETFTWYKNKSRRPIPKGQSRVVIWLSQM